MWDSICLVECGDCGCEGAEGCDLGTGEQSVELNKREGFFLFCGFFTKTRERDGGRGGMDRLLGFELIGENQVRFVEKIFVNRNHILIDIKVSVITHDWIQNCIYPSV